MEKNDRNVIESMQITVATKSAFNNIWPFIQLVLKTKIINIWLLFFIDEPFLSCDDDHYIKNSIKIFV